MTRSSRRSRGERRLDDSLVTTDGTKFSSEPGFYIEKNLLDRVFTQTFSHPIVEIGCVQSGRGRLYYNGAYYPLGPGDGYFLDMQSPHRHDPELPGGLRSLFVHIKYEALEALAPRDEYGHFIQPFLFLQAGSVEPVIRDNAGFNAVLNEAYDLYHSDDPYGYVLAWSKIIGAFVEVGRYCDSVIQETGPTRLPRNRATIARALHYVTQHYREPIALADIAAFAGVSPSRLSSVFSTHMHSSPIAYRNKLRINRAQDLLTNTAKNVEEIAFECGFHSLAQFRTLFKRLTGRPPSAVRMPR